MKFLFLLQKLFLDPAFFDKTVQPQTVFLHRVSFSGHLLRKGGDLRDKFLPEDIQVHQIRRIHAPVIPHPGFLPLRKASDSQGQHIIFQTVRFLPGHIRQAAPQIPEHTLIGKALTHHLQGCPYEFHKGVHQHTVGLVDEAGDLPETEDLPGQRGIFLQIAGDHRDIAVPEILLPDQPADPTRRVLHLLPGRGCAPDSDLLRL